MFQTPSQRRRLRFCRAGAKQHNSRRLALESLEPRLARSGTWTALAHAAPAGIGVLCSIQMGVAGLRKRLRTKMKKHRLILLLAIAAQLAAVVLSVSARGDNIYALGGGTIEKFTSNGVGSIFANQVPGGGLAVDSTGNVYVGNYPTILKFNPNGTSSVFATMTSGYEQEGLAVDSAGNVYASLYAFTTNLIEKFTPAGHRKILAYVDPPGPMAIDSTGNVYVTGGGIAGIDKITPIGDVSTFVDNTFYFGPIACDSTDNVYAVDYHATGGSAIVKYTPTGAGTVFAPVSLANNDSLAVDSGGNVFYSDNSTIEKFTPAGVGTVFANFGAGAIAIQRVPNIPTISGDYNGNGIVDAADYTVWRDSLGSTTNLAADGNGNGAVDQEDYNVWRSNFGHTAVSNPLLGDYNHNGVVDAADYTLWRDSLGATVAPGSGADGNGDGVIDQGDYDAWKANYGNHSGAGAGANAAVPEPTSLLLFVVGTLIMLTGGRAAVISPAVLARS